ncbi:MAG: hypothetical protein EHM78_00060 [Myxococcaceae bacterium]|nr:MAG: hypothetical protein EHM78_00060 [Myxococcaceae bacterium]
MARPPPVRDPRYRPYRVAVIAVYLVVVSTFCLLVTASVARSVRTMSPRREPVRTATLAPEACVERASVLLDELEGRRRALTGITPASRADTSWMSFRVEWLERVRQAERSCGVDLPERKELAELFDQLEHLEDLYTTSAVQYAGEIGPALDRFHRMVAQTRGGR